ncbi:MAG: RcnB family protein [Rhizobiales bacterium]|nr:RcnB family protein [Hyphomicrobiales bacterium]
MHRSLAGFAIRAIFAAVLLVALSGLAAAQHEEDHRRQQSPQQHPGGGPPPGRPFIPPHGPNGPLPGAQIGPGVGPYPPRREVVRPGGPLPGAEVVRPGGPAPEFLRPGEPHRGAEFVRPGGAQFLYRGRTFERVRSEPFAYPPGWGYRRWEVGAFLPPVFLIPDYWYPDWELIGLPPPPPDYQWVRYGSDLLLVDLTSGEVIDAVYDVFY